MSDTYKALTRKYRPDSFEDIVSQEHVSETLKNAIKQNRLSHAYMFCGPRGVGKTTMARVLARTINNIDTGIDGESLNQTLNVVEMDAASNNKVEDVHHLRESVRIPPQNGKYKVFIIDEVHMLSKAAFNALLKTLEEPPEHAIFIFATTEPHKVLPTILSRVQRFDFKRISVDEIVLRLKNIAADENINIDEESLHVIAKKADGALRDALGLMDQAIAFCGDNIQYNELLKALNVVGSDRLFEFMTYIKNQDADGGLSLINTLLEEGYDIQEFLVGLTEHLRNLYIATENKNLYLVEASEETKKRYLSRAQEFSREDYMRMLHVVSEAQYKIKDASQPRILFEITLLKLIHLGKSEAIQKILSDLEALKKNSGNFLKGDQNSPDENVSAEESSANESMPQSEASKNINGRLKSDAEDAKAHPENSDQDSVKPETETLTSSPKKINNTNGSAKAHNTSEDKMATGVSEPDDDFDIGRPALETNLSKSRLSTQVKNFDETEEVHLKEKKKIRTEKVDLTEVKEVWPEYLEAIKAEFPMLLHLQMERIELLSLKGNQLHFRCDNAFAKKMLEEQEKELSKHLREFIGKSLRFDISVERNSEQRVDKNSPYERFKKLKQEHPIIKDIVDIFGAEPEF